MMTLEQPVPNHERTERATPTDVSISADELIRLKRVDLLRGLEDELSEWASKRFKTALIVGTILGLVGIQAIAYFIINQMLGSKIEEAAIAAAVLKDGADRIKVDAKAATDKANEAFRLAEEQRLNVSQSLEGLKEQAQNLGIKLQEIQERSIAVSENVRAGTNLDIKGVQSQVDILFSEINKIHNELNISSVLKQEETRVRDELSEEKEQFESNSKYEIDVIYTSSRKIDAETLISRMRSVGFRVNDFGSDALEFEDIAEAISSMKERYGSNVVESDDTETNEYIKSKLSEIFPDWEIVATAEERSSGEAFEWYGLNIVLM